MLSTATTPPSPVATAVEGLFALADESERLRDFAGAIRCLSAALSTPTPLLPLTEARARVRLASLLLNRTSSLSLARSHLERALLILSPLPSAPPHLRLLASSLLASAYNTSGAIPPQKNVLLRAIQFLRRCTAISRQSVLLWECNLQAQLASALVVDADQEGALSAISEGAAAAREVGDVGLELFFAASDLHVRLLAWDDSATVEAAVLRANSLLEALPEGQYRGLFFYTELLHTFYLLRICDYKSASQRVEQLDNAMKSEKLRLDRVSELITEFVQFGVSVSRHASHRQHAMEEQLRDLTGLESLDAILDYGEKLLLAPPPMNGEWIPKSAVFALVDLMVVMVGRPKGIFKECVKRIQSGMQLIHEELTKLGITDSVTEVNLQRSSIWMAGLYLVLLLQFLENKVAVDLTRSEFVEAQEALVQMKNWFARFPMILQGYESTIEMLRGQYAHSVGCFQEAVYHFLEAIKLTESKSMQSMCQVYAAVSYICMGDPESSSQALDLVGPAFRIMDSYIGVREKTCIIFVYGLLLMRQHNLQEARVRLASGLRIAHQQLGNIQLVSQYLTILGTLALQLHDIGQAREILKSSLTLAKTLYDIPTQIWVLSVFTDLYQELGERANEVENSEYEKKKEEELQRKISEARSQATHLDLIEKVRIVVHSMREVPTKQALSASAKIDLDIPESIGLPTPQPTASSRLRDMDSVRRGKRKL